MNFRFPEIFGTLLFLAILASLGLPRAGSGPVENSLAIFFSPIAAPLQRYRGDADARRLAQAPAPPILPASPDDSAQQQIARLTAERVELERYAASLREQLETLNAQQAEMKRVGEHLRPLVNPVNVIGVDSGRDVIRLAAAGMKVESGAAVASEAGIVGRVLDVGVANQASVRLITDRGFKLVGRFIRARANADNSIALEPLRLEPTLIEGMGGGEMRIDSLKNDAVAASGLRVGDVVVLADDRTGAWRIELHGQRVGVVTAVGASPTSQGIAEIRVRPEADLKSLRQVWLILPPQRMPARE